MSPNSRTARITGAILAAAMLAACSGANPSSMPSTQQAFKWNGPVGKLSFRLKLPTRKRQADIAQLISRAETARGMKPNFFPGSATTLVFKLLKINGTTATQPTPYNFTATLSTCNTTSFTLCTVTGGTSAQAHCKLVASAYSCTIYTNAPAATDTFQILTENTSSGTKILSQSALSVGVSVGGTPAGSFALDPVVSKMAWDSGWIDNTAPYIDTSASSGGNSGGGNGPNEPAWTAYQGYTCPSASNTPPVYCSDPLVNGPASSGATVGVAVNDTLVLNLEDAAGDIVLPATGDVSPNIPIYVNAAGNEVNVYVNCNNADIQWLKSSASAVTYATLSTTSPTATANPSGVTPNPLVANGASSLLTGVLTKFVGNGNPNSTGLPQMNSPETGADGTPGGGTDALGNVITDAIWSNDGNSLNFDGGGNASSGAQSWTCTASATATGGSGIAAVKYYVGYAEGAISGATRRIPIKIHQH